MLALLVAGLMACGQDRPADDDDDSPGDGDADADGDVDGDADADVDADADGDVLQVDLQYTTFCDDGGCPTVDHAELVGRNGDPIPALAGATLGIECEIETDGDQPVLSSLQVQDQPVGVTPDNGLHVRDGALPLGSSMTCGNDGIHLFEGNEFVGGCEGLTNEQCAIFVTAMEADRGFLILEIDCQALAPLSGTTRRSVRRGLLTIDGCTLH